MSLFDNDKPVSPEADAVFSMYKNALINKTFFGRVDSWVGRAILSFLWDKRDWLITQFFQEIRYPSRNICAETLTELYSVVPVKYLRPRNYVSPMTGDLLPSYQRAPLLRIAGVLVGWRETNPGYIDFYIQKQHVEKVLDVIARHSCRPRLGNIGKGNRAVVEDRGDSTLVSWYSYANPCLSTTLDQLPIHSETRVKLNKIVAEYSDLWWNSDGHSRRELLVRWSASCNIVLEGPKGSGKTSIAHALAVALQTSTYPYPTVEDAIQFWELVYNISRNSVVVADEADTLLFTDKEDPAINIRDSTSVKASVKDTLDYLTGPRQPSGVITVICTNDTSKFDERVLREGRVHHRWTVAEVDHEGLVYWFEKNHPEVDITGLVFKPVLMTRVFTLIRTLKNPTALAQALTQDQPKEIPDAG